VTTGLNRRQIEALRRRVESEQQSDAAAPPANQITQRPAAAIIAADPTQADPARTTLISNIFGEEIMFNTEKVHAILRSQNEVKDLSLQVFEGQIGIGRSIGALRAALAEEEWKKLLANASRIYGAHLSAPTVTKLISVADAIDSRRLPVERLPKHYTLLYEFTVMTDTLFRKAEEARLIRPDVSRSEIIEWKREALITLSPPGQRSPRVLRQAKNRLMRQRRLLVQRLAQIDQEIAEIEAELGEKRPEDA